jgi:hypothetical protein
MRLIDRACQTAGTDNFGGDLFGGDGWREGLDRLVHGLNTEAELTRRGAFLARRDLEGFLATRLRVVDWHLRHPEMSAADVVPPVVIVGQPRSGTTILFDLLAQDPAHRAPLTWEVEAPIPPPEAATYQTDPRIAKIDAYFKAAHAVVPEIETVHPTGARLAQECARITASAFRSIVFIAQYKLPSYGKWLLAEADMTSALCWHRRFLQLLQWHCPGERWLLKAPSHLWSLDALVRQYPKVLIIQTHRDPLRTIASLTSFVATVRRLSTDSHDLRETATECQQYIIDGLDRSLAAREGGLVPPGHVIDVHYAALMADPMAQVRRIYQQLGFQLSAAAESRMRAFLQAAQHGRRPHNYSFSDTGLDELTLRRHTAPYQEYFAVPQEPL